MTPSDCLITDIPDGETGAVAALAKPSGIASRGGRPGSRWSSYVFHGGTLSLADQMVASATNFLTGVILGRACGKEQFGFYMLGFTVMLFVMDLQTSLISTPYMVFSPRYRGAEAVRYNGSTLVHQLVLSLLAVAGLIFGATAVGLGGGPAGLIGVLWALSGSIAFIMLREYTRRICFARLHIGAALLADTLVAVIQLGSLLVMWKLELLSPSNAYWVIGIACGLTGVAWLASHRREFRPTIHHSAVDLLRNWKFGKWVLASGLLWTLSIQLYPWLLVAFSGVAEVGAWAACLMLVNVGNVLLMGAQNYLGPKIVQSHAAGGTVALNRVVVRSSAVLSAVTLLFSLMLLGCGGWLVELIFGAKYAGNGSVVAVLGASLLASALGFATSRGLWVIGRADTDFYVNFVALFILLTAGLGLVATLGTLGAAWGMVVANTAGSLVRAAAFFRLSPGAAGKLDHRGP